MLADSLCALALLQTIIISGRELTGVSLLAYRAARLSTVGTHLSNHESFSNLH